MRSVDHFWNPSNYFSFLEELEMKNEGETCGFHPHGRICRNIFGLCKEGLYCHKLYKGCDPGRCRKAGKGNHNFLRYFIQLDSIIEWSQLALKVLFISTLHLLVVESFEPPKGCKCIESTSDDGKNCYVAPAKCGIWGGSDKFHWCYVADESSCKTKEKGNCGPSYWTKCPGKLNFYLLLITTKQ